MSVHESQVTPPVGYTFLCVNPDLQLASFILPSLIIFFSELKFRVYIFIYKKIIKKIMSGIMFFTHLKLRAKSQSDK